MDFLGFLEEKRIFLEFLIKRKLSPTGRPHGIPGSQLRPGSPVARGGAWLPTGQPQPIRRLPVRLAVVWPFAWPASCVAGRIGSWGSFLRPLAHVGARAHGSRTFLPPRVRDARRNAPDGGGAAAACRRRGAPAGPTCDRCEGEV
jgi:hypothetical protein